MSSTAQQRVTRDKVVIRYCCRQYPQAREEKYGVVSLLLTVRWHIRRRVSRTLRRLNISIYVDTLDERFRLPPAGRSKEMTLSIAAVANHSCRRAHVPQQRAGRETRAVPRTYLPTITLFVLRTTLSRPAKFDRGGSSWRPLIFSHSTHREALSQPRPISPVGVCYFLLSVRLLVFLRLERAARSLPYHVGCMRGMVMCAKGWRLASDVTFVGPCPCCVIGKACLTYI